MEYQPLHGNVRRLFCAERSRHQRLNENVISRTILLDENHFDGAMFDFVKNGKISSENSISAAGIEGRTAKCISTKGGDKSLVTKEKGRSPHAPTVRAIKAHNGADMDQKGRDASGASEGAEALIASSDSAQPMSASAFESLSAKGAPL